MLANTGGQRAKGKARAIRAFECGAGGGNRTPDLSLTKRLLYQLSYTGTKGAKYTEDHTPTAMRTPL